MWVGPEVDVEVGLGEAEQDADVVLVGESRVDDDAALGVEEGQRERDGGTAGVEPPQEVAALAPEEGRADDLRPVEAVADSGRLQLGGDPLRRQRRITARVGVGRVPGEVAEHRLDEGGDVVDRVVEAAEAVGGFDRGCLEVGIDEFDVRVDAEGGEDPPGDRVEERLAELPVLPAGDQARVDRLGARPDDRVGDPFGEGGPHVPLDAVDDRAVDVEPLGRVLGGALPVAALEAGLGAPRDLVERFPMALERLRDGDRGQVREPAGREIAGRLSCHASQRSRRAGWDSLNRKHP